MAALNVRVDARTAAFLERIARETGSTKSEVVRRALENLRVQGTRTAQMRPAAAMARLIGCWDSGGMALSVRTGERFARLLQEKADGRSTGRRRTARRAH